MDFYFLLQNKDMVNKSAISWRKAAAIGLAFGALMIGLGALCARGHEFILLCIFTAPAIGLVEAVKISGIEKLLLLSPLWWTAMFLCAALPAKKALYGFIIGECIHFAVVIWIAIERELWAELASDWKEPCALDDFFTRLTCIGIYLAGHVFMILLRLKANHVNPK